MNLEGASVEEFVKRFKDKIPSDYEVTNEGLFHKEKDRRGESKMKQLAYVPIVVLGIEQQRDGTKPIVVFASKNISNKLVTVRIPLCEIGTRGSGSQRLHDAGVLLAPNCENDLFRFVAASRQLLQGPTYYSTRTGWFERDGLLKAFVLPEETITIDENEHVKFYNGGADTFAMYKQSGTLEEWKSNVAEQITGNPVLIFALILSFTGPVMRFANHEGFIFHIHGRSSSGKSSALQIAGTTWGSGSLNSSNSFLKSWRTTVNAMELLAEAHNETLLGLDELHLFPGGLSDFIYFMTHGCGKNAMKQDRSARATYRWTVPVISAGEKSILETMKINQEKISEGQLIRAFDLPIRADIIVADPHEKTPADYVKSLKENVGKYYGVAGPAFLRMLLEVLTNSYGDFVDGFNSFKPFCKELLLGKEPSGSDLVDRAVDKFSVILFAGTSAITWGILPYTEDEINNAVKYCFDLWRKGVTLEADELKENRNRLRNLISTILRNETYTFEDKTKSQAFHSKSMGLVCVPSGEFQKLFPNKASRTFLVKDLNRNKELHKEQGEDGKNRNILKRMSPLTKQKTPCYCVYIPKEGELFQ